MTETASLHDVAKQYEILANQALVLLDTAKTSIIQQGQLFSDVVNSLSTANKRIMELEEELKKKKK